MKKNILSFLVMLTLFFATSGIAHAQATFINNAGHSMNVRFSYQSNGATCASAGDFIGTVAPNSSWSPPLAPLGHSYYRCDVSSWCRVTNPSATVFDVSCGPTTAVMGNPTTGCGWNVGVTSPTPVFEVTVQ